MFLPCFSSATTSPTLPDQVILYGAFSNQAVKANSTFPRGQVWTDATSTYLTTWNPSGSGDASAFRILAWLNPNQVWSTSTNKYIEVRYRMEGSCNALLVNGYNLMKSYDNTPHNPFTFGPSLTASTTGYKKFNLTHQPSFVGLGVYLQSINSNSTCHLTIYSITDFTQTEYLFNPYRHLSTTTSTSSSSMFYSYDNINDMQYVDTMTCTSGSTSSICSYTYLPANEIGFADIFFVLLFILFVVFSFWLGLLYFGVTKKPIL